MKPLLIGSRAMDILCFPDKPISRPDSDADFICETPYISPQGYRTECHSLDMLNNRVIFTDYRLEIPASPYDIVTIKGMKILKRSHLHRPEGWDKHITHYHKHLSRVFLDPTDMKVLQERKKLTYEAFGNRHPKLTQSNEDFFDDNVEKVYDHDFLHELFAYYERPLFESLKLEGQEGKAWCEESLFNRLDHKDKLRCVAEESYVIASERFLIPNNWQGSSKKAYYMALKKVCTTLTSGWFRDFALNYWPGVWGLYDPEKFNRVRRKLK